MSTSQHCDLNITVLNEERFGGSNMSLKNLVSLDIFSEEYLFRFVDGGQKLTPFVLNLRIVSNLRAVGKERSGIWGKKREGREASLCRARCIQVSSYKMSLIRVSLRLLVRSDRQEVSCLWLSTVAQGQVFKSKGVNVNFPHLTSLVDGVTQIYLLML